MTTSYCVGNLSEIRKKAHFDRYQTCADLPNQAWTEPGRGTGFAAIRALGLGRPGAALTHCPAWICIFEGITDIGLMATQLKQRLNQLTWTIPAVLHGSRP